MGGQEFQPMEQDPKTVLNYLQKNKDTIEKTIREQARFMRIAFQALTAEGFNEIQALEIIKARGFLA